MKNIVLVDIDGTLSNQDHRNHFLTQSPKDWNSYFQACDKDEPIQDVIDMVKHLSASGYSIVYCTGRKESVRQKTKEWIGEYVHGNKLVLPFDSYLLMRKDGDFRHDTEAKPELLKEARISLDDIAFVLEDRNSMVKKWRELGLTCLQVAEGDF